ncbi:MAG: radical SAM family heme chaperone HemW [Chlamydiia bacterium]|nr:radical SAM family heme chaperone HemW [Chlamydiia bacterium]
MVIPLGVTNENTLSLYFHVPFCTKKCQYCHFYVLPDQKRFKQKYLEALKIEWEWRLPLIKGKKLVSIYFGGGTPSLLGPSHIAEILDWIQIPNETEVTLEANPENMTYELAKQFFEGGINRLSIGVQSFNDDELKLLGRTHTSAQAITAIENVYRAGFGNISIDLIYDLPDQTLPLWKNTLKQGLDLPISHLSLYNLTLEPHTGFFKQRKQLFPRMASPELSLAFLETAISDATIKGLKRYEISAFAKPDFFSRHNLGYWIGRPFLGFGPSAYSYWEGKRFSNLAHFNRWAKKILSNENPVNFEEELTVENQRKELLSIGLRVLNGISLKAFEQRFGKLDEITHQKLRLFKSEGYLENLGDQIKLTHRGTMVYDTLAIELI